MRDGKLPFETKFELGWGQGLWGSGEKLNDEPYVDLLGRQAVLPCAHEMASWDSELAWSGGYTLLLRPGGCWSEYRLFRADLRVRMDEIHVQVVVKDDDRVRCALALDFACPDGNQVSCVLPFRRDDERHPRWGDFVTT